jgi:hypothetical protein
MTDPRDSEQGPVLPVAGPLERWPDATTAQARAMLDTALSGLGLGPVDQDARDRLTGLDPVGLDPVAAAAAIASWVHRSFQAGHHAGRAEARAQADKLERAVATLKRVNSWWRDATAERDEAREDLEAAAAAEERYGRVVDEVVAAATEAECVVEDDTADTRVALRVLLVGIERAVAGVAR